MHVTISILNLKLINYVTVLTIEKVNLAILQTCKEEKNTDDTVFSSSGKFALHHIAAAANLDTIAVNEVGTT